MGVDSEIKPNYNEINNNSQENLKKIKTEKKVTSTLFKIKRILFVAIILSALVLILQILSLIFHRKPQISPQKPSKPSLAPTIPVSQLSITISPSQQVAVYGLSNNNLKKITSFQPLDDIGLEGKVPVIDQAGFIYYVVGNSVKQLSLDTQTVKEIYVNTKIATKIANISYHTPSNLYIGIIIDPSDPNYSKQLDHNSYIIALNLADNTVRTIGPFKTLTFGALDYLFPFQNQDIIKLLRQQYCRGEGEIYSVAGDNITFISANSFGCNGSDPYFIGFRENDGKLFFAMPDPSTNPDDFVSRYKELFSLDLSNQQRQTLFDLSSIFPPKSNIPYENTKFFISEDGKNIYIATKSKIYTFDITGRQLSKDFDLAGYPNSTLITIANNSVYLINSIDKKFTILNLKDFSSASFQQQIATDPTIIDPLHYLGIWKNTPLFYTTITLP